MATAAENTSMIGFDFDIENWWNEKWIPIFHNGAGDYICLDTGGIFTGREGQLIEFWHADKDRNIIAPTLELLLSKLNHYYETIQPKDFDEYFTTESLKDYPKRYKVG